MKPEKRKIREALDPYRHCRLRRDMQCLTVYYFIEALAKFFFYILFGFIFFIFLLLTDNIFMIFFLLTTFLINE